MVEDGAAGRGSGNLKKTAVRGTAVTLMGQGAKFVSQLTTTFLLARLVDPAGFGIYAMVTPIVSIALLVQDLGLTQAVVTARDMSQPKLSAMFMANLAVSALVATVIAACAPLIARFYGSEAVIPVVYVMAATLFVSGASSVHRALLTRRLRYGAIARNEVISMVVGAAGAVALTFVLPGPMALVSQNAVASLTLLALSWSSSRWLPGRPARFGEIVDLLRFGGGLTGFNIFNFIARSADNIIIGRFTGPVQLGLYDRSYKLMLMPLQQINNPTSRVMVPILSKLVDDPDRYRAAYLRTASILLLITLPGVVFFVAGADPLIPVALGERWRPATAIFAWLSIAALHQPLSATTGWLFISQSRTGEFARWGVINAVTCVAAFFAGLPWGAVGVAAAYAISDLGLRCPLVWWLVGRRGPVSTGDFYRLAAPYALAIGVSLPVLLGLRRLLALGDLATLVVLASVSYAVFWAVIAVTPSGKKTFAELGKTATPLMPARLRRLLDRSGTVPI